MKSFTTHQLAELHRDVPCMDFSLDKLKWVKIKDILNELEYINSQTEQYTKDLILEQLITELRKEVRR
jgi:hypothetical protein